ncbi:uncharacterized protein LOC142337167 [Convolutriloba macropyga]|uniref:uncharacterized protein LOC142337167 n=1 Tax=Convolutriloba macropyga TaxID=536237 RepID=UPI003F520E90
MSLMTLYDDDEDDETEPNIPVHSCENTRDNVTEADVESERVDLEASAAVAQEESEGESSSSTRFRTGTRASTLRRSSRKAAHRLSWMYPVRSRNRLPRNLTNRKGSYLARRIAKNVAPSGSRHTRDWTLKEKAKLLKALQTVTDPDDYESVASHIVTRNADEVRLYIQSREKHMMKRKDYYLDLFNIKEPAAPSPLSQWMNICSHNSNEMLAKALHEVFKLASFEPQSVAEMRLDFSLMYNYLANLIVDKDLPELSPLEACILWDTISEVYGSSAVQSNPECVNHLRRQFEALTSTTGEVKLRAGCYSNINETLNVDQSLAYQSALAEGMIVKLYDMGDISITSGRKKGRRKSKSKGCNASDSMSVTSEDSLSTTGDLIDIKEFNKLKDCINELTGVQLISPRKKGRSRAENLASELRTEDQRDELDRQCYSALNPLSLPAKFLSHPRLVEGSILSIDGKNDRSREFDELEDLPEETEIEMSGVD